MVSCPFVADQTRLRENLRVAPGGSDLGKVATKKLLDQEAQLERIDAETRSATEARESARAVGLGYGRRRPGPGSLGVVVRPERRRMAKRRG